VCSSDLNDGSLTTRVSENEGRASQRAQAHSASPSRARDQVAGFVSELTGRQGKPSGKAVVRACNAHTNTGSNRAA